MVLEASTTATVMWLDSVKVSSSTENDGGVVVGSWNSTGVANVVEVVVVDVVIACGCVQEDHTIRCRSMGSIKRGQGW